MDEVFGPFRLISRIGRGGMGETFVAERRGVAGFVQRVCLKRAIHWNDDPIWARIFQQEARLAALLKHPNIVAVHELGEEDGRWWMAMDLVEGIDLGRLFNVTRARGEMLPLDVVVLIAFHVAEALEHAHERPLLDGTPGCIVHRDVKPANVLLGHDGIVKLSDFGIAKYAQSDRTRTGVVKGTVPYMSPEQHQQARDIDGRSDLFSLGVMLFELIAGKRPFDGATEIATLTNISLGKRTADLPTSRAPELQPLVLSMIDADRDRRPRSASMVVEALATHTRLAARRTIGQMVRAIRPPGPVPAEGELTEAAGATEPEITVREKR